MKVVRSIAMERPFNPNNRLFKKELLTTHLEKIKSGAKSYDEFLSHLQLKNYEPYYRGTDKTLTGIKSEGIKYRFKTLGFDAQVLHDYYKNIPNEEKEIEEIQRLRRRTKDRDRVKEFPLITPIEGYGEASPFNAFNQEELSFTR